MPDDIATIISALIGAISGSLGATVINDLLRSRGERMALREGLVNRYLLQLQDAIDSLGLRLHNIKKGGGGGEKRMDDAYYEVSTLYALACILAYKRILLLDGVYSQLGEQLGRDLKEKMQKFELEIDNNKSLTKFFHYDRLALAESVIEKEDGHLGTCTYMKFKKQFQENEGQLKLSFESAKNFVSTIKGSDEANGLLNKLIEISKLVEKQTGIESNINQYSVNNSIG